MKKIQTASLICLFFFYTMFLPPWANAGYKNSYLTVVIPLRGRDYWHDFNKVTPLLDFIKEKKIPVTLLIQYQNLSDIEVISYLKKLPNSFELGIFLEVDESLANSSYVSYLYGIGDRAHSNIILLSGYDISERKRLIDQNFKKFKSIFNFTPKSVGAWYIDAISQNFLIKKYNITSALTVADQWNTDTYGIWGSPWSVPYLASSFNGLIPQQNSLDNSGLVKIQWAARDPVSGYGLTVNDSTYSIQANDYLEGHKLDINYFNHLAKTYLTQENFNNLSQLTLGLEAGQEGNIYLAEFKNQINSLVGYPFVTMSSFAEVYKSEGKVLQKVIQAQSYFDSSIKGFWLNFKNYRAYIAIENKKVILKDLRSYHQHYLDIDVFRKDTNKNLIRIIPSCIDFAQFHESVTLSDSVDKILPEFQDKGIILNLYTASGSKGNLTFNENGIYKSGKGFYRIENSNMLTDLLSSSFYKIILDFQTGKKYALSPKIAFSKLNGIYFLGLSFPPRYFAGIYSKFPFIGFFKFPFQVLTKFKSVDYDKLSLIYLNSFVKSSVNCKISS